MEPINKIPGKTQNIIHYLNSTRANGSLVQHKLTHVNAVTPPPPNKEKKTKQKPKNPKLKNKKLPQAKQKPKSMMQCQDPSHPFCDNQMPFPVISI